jgi:hypothetical protein
MTRPRLLDLFSGAPMRADYKLCGCMFGLSLPGNTGRLDWMNRDELSQAIPPAYTEHIGTALFAHLRERAV